MLWHTTMLEEYNYPHRYKIMIQKGKLLMSEEMEAQSLSSLSSCEYYQRSNSEIKIFFAAMAIGGFSHL